MEGKCVVSVVIFGDIRENWTLFLAVGILFIFLGTVGWGLPSSYRRPA